MCLFCTVRPARKNREHLLPDWLADDFPDDGPQQHYRRVQTPFGHNDQVYPQRPFRAKTGCTCKECNHGWMSDLETAVNPVLRSLLLTPLIVPLSREAQRQIARWVFLRLLVFQHAQGEGPKALPPEHYAFVYEHGDPPPGVQMWIGRRAHEGAWPYRYTALSGEWRRGPRQDRPPVTEEDFNVHQAVLYLGHLVAHVSVVLDGAGRIAQPDAPRAALVEIWPEQRLDYWPPRARVDADRLDALFDMEGRYVDRNAA